MGRRNGLTLDGKMGRRSPPAVGRRVESPLWSHRSAAPR